MNLKVPILTDKYQDEISELPEKKSQLSDKKDEDKRILDFFSDIFKPKEKQKLKMIWLSKIQKQI